MEMEALRADENIVWLPPINPESEYRFETKERQRTRKNSLVQFWDTKEEAKQYLTDKLNAEIFKYEKQIFKAKAKIEALR